MHNSYIIPGVDEAVMKTQAHKRLEDKYHPEPTAIHYHGNAQPCNEKCYLIQEVSDD